MNKGITAFAQDLMKLKRADYISISGCLFLAGYATMDGNILAVATSVLATMFIVLTALFSKLINEQSATMAEQMVVLERAMEITRTQGEIIDKQQATIELNERIIKRQADAITELRS